MAFRAVKMGFCKTAAQSAARVLLHTSHCIAQNIKVTSTQGPRFNKMSNFTASSKTLLTVSGSSFYSCECIAMHVAPSGGWWRHWGPQTQFLPRCQLFDTHLCFCTSSANVHRHSSSIKIVLTSQTPERVSGTAQGSMEHSVRSAGLGYPPVTPTALAYRAGDPRHTRQRNSLDVLQLS